MTDWIADLQDAKAIAKEKGNSNALVTATMAQAKLLGLDIKKHSETHNAQPAQIVVNVIDAKKSS